MTVTGIQGKMQPGFAVFNETGKTWSTFASVPQYIRGARFERLPMEMQPGVEVVMSNDGPTDMAVFVIYESGETVEESGETGRWGTDGPWGTLLSSNKNSSK